MTGAFISIAAAVALATTGTARAAAPCMTPAEAQALVAALLPDMLKAVGDRCAAALPEDAVMRGGLTPLMARLRTEAVATQPLALAGASKMMGTEGHGISGSTGLTMIGEVAAAAVVKDIKLKDCATIDRGVTLMAPLPAANIAGLVVLALQSQGPKGLKDLNICSAAKP